ncbi:MAG: AI-2E family transporter, partial [Chitinophagaceae bacterium]|nr:AI-2E family transporter [Rubrivivax sp.]
MKTDAPATTPVSPPDEASQGVLAAGPVGGALSSLQLCLGLVTASIVIGALYFGRDILMPLALAVLLGFLLDPLVGALRRRRVPRTVAVILVVVTSLALLAAAGVLLANQVRSLSAELPTYQSNIRFKLRELRGHINAPGMFDGAVRTFEVVRKEVEGQVDAVASGRQARAAPQRVVVDDRPVSPITQALQRLEAAAEILTTTGIVLVFVVLVLLDRQDLRFRLLRLLGGNLHRTTDAIGEAGTRISRYLTMQFAINLSYGVPLAIGLALIGVPGAILWGAVAGVMRFVPYVGPLIAAVFPLTLAFAIDPGWNMLLWTLALIVVLELIINNLIEPWLYGVST